MAKKKRPGPKDPVDMKKAVAKKKARAKKRADQDRHLKLAKPKTKGTSAYK